MIGEISPYHSFSIRKKFFLWVKECNRLASVDIKFRVAVSRELCLAPLFFDRRLPQGLPNIDANFLNGIVPIAKPIPLWRVGLCSVCHIRRSGGNHQGIGLLKTGDKLPPLPAMSLRFPH